MFKFKTRPEQIRSEVIIRKNSKKEVKKTKKRPCEKSQDLRCVFNTY